MNTLFKPEEHDTRTAILLATLNIIASQGMQGLSIRNVAAEVGVTAGAIYRHFDSKESMLKELRKMLRDRLVSGLYGNVDLDLPLRQQFDAIIRNLLAMFMSRREALFADSHFRQLADFDPQAEHMADQLALARWHTLLEMGIRQGQIRPLPLYQLDALTIGACRSLAMSPDFRDAGNNWSDFIGCIWDAIAAPTTK